MFTTSTCQVAILHNLYANLLICACPFHRWWPAEVVSPKSIPDSLLSSKPTRCMFLVRFFASSQYFWTHHGRVIAFTEECAVIRDDKKNRSNPAAKQSQALYTQGTLQVYVYIIFTYTKTSVVTLLTIIWLTKLSDCTFNFGSFTSK